MYIRQISRWQLFVVLIALAMMLVACIGPALTPGDAASTEPLLMVDAFHIATIAKMLMLCLLCSPMMQLL